MRLRSLPSHFHPKLFDWTSKIRDSSDDAKWREILCHCREMVRAGIEVTDPATVFPLILKACSNASFGYGTSLQGFLIKKGLESHASIGNSTMDFYAKSGHLDSALVVFRCLENRDSVSWNIVVHGHLSGGDSRDALWWFEKARLDGFEPNNSTLVLVFQACRNLGAKREGKKLHGFVIKSGFLGIRSVRNSLLSMYEETECEMGSARKVFDEMPERDVVSWSAVIKGYASSGEARVGLKMFLKMVSESRAEPDGLTVVSVLRACASLGDAAMGKSVHGLAIRRGLDSDLFVGNSLIDVYSKCSDPGSAIEAFNDMPRRNIVTWNSLISGLVLNGKYSEALSLFDSMEKYGIEADAVSIVSVLQICKHFAEPSWPKSVHCVVFKRGCESNESVLNSLIDSYAKCGFVDYAHKTFDSIEEKSRVSWSTMIAGFARFGRPEDAISVFREMVRAQEKPNSATIVNLLGACSVLADLKRAKWAHGIAVRRGSGVEEEEEALSMGTAILDMYSKCGEIEASRRVFSRQFPGKKSVVAWSAMISAYATNGLAREALALHDEMRLNGVRPNAVTTLGVLSACSHGGLVEEGLDFFASMHRVHGVEPGPEHYSCVVDMLGRAGKLGVAKEFIEKMHRGFGFGSESSAKAWGSLLSACKSHGNSELGSEAAARVLELEPNGSSGYLLGSAVYASGGLWAEAARMRRLVRERGVKVVAGCSVVHVGDTSCKFVAGDFSHTNIGDIKSMVELLHSCMKKLDLHDKLKEQVENAL